MTMSGESELTIVMLSSIESYAYCPRQCALRFLDQAAGENLYMLRGRRVHERVHSGEETMVDGVRTVRSLSLYSDVLGLVGQADAVEFHAGGPYPIEYKSGPVHRLPAELQLCGQAMCLEEMFGVPVPEGAIYRAAGHNRRAVQLTPKLRQQCCDTIVAVRLMLDEQTLPPPISTPARCRGCSLLEICMPDVLRDAPRATRFLASLYVPTSGDRPEVP
ncbi:MAG: CRISPR-associated protein Cas4 [Anaerolineae bacterium]|jgi:CRISPR-associated exonuclease Cas4